MIYEIQDKSDLLSGASLVVRMPEEELDRKALHTIEGDKPDFLLPFYHRVIDGQIEFVYQIGARSKLQYLTGDRYPKDYIALWSSLLNPLLDCGDWFLRPYSFIMDVDRLYCDKNTKTISYVYVPSVRDCSDYCSLKNIAAEFSRLMTVTDAELENKVLRAIMMNFNPKAFLQMLKSYTDERAPVAYISDAAPRPGCEMKALPATEPAVSKHEEIIIPESFTAPCCDSIPDTTGEIIINIPAGWGKAKKNKKKVKEKDAARGKKEKRQTRPEPAPPPVREAPRPQPVAQQHTQAHTQLHTQAPEYRAQPVETDGATQCILCDAGGTWLRRIGSESLPAGIDVAIAEGEVFTVGRYDTAIGRRQSSFEFDKATKAVSRRHAAIERRPEGYSIIDLLSSAGTFVNGQKLPPNTPFTLQPGCRVSFGNCGADYIWEQ